MIKAFLNTFIANILIIAMLISSISSPLAVAQTRRTPFQEFELNMMVNAKVLQASYTYPDLLPEIIHSTGPTNNKKLAKTLKYITKNVLKDFEKTKPKINKIQNTNHKKISLWKKMATKVKKLYKKISSFVARETKSQIRTKGKIRGSIYITFFVVGWFIEGTVALLLAQIPIIGKLAPFVATSVPYGLITANIGDSGFLLRDYIKLRKLFGTIEMYQRYQAFSKKVKKEIFNNFNEYKEFIVPYINPDETLVHLLIQDLGLLGKVNIFRKINDHYTFKDPKLNYESLANYCKRNKFAIDLTDYLDDQKNIPKYQKTYALWWYLNKYFSVNDMHKELVSLRLRYPQRLIKNKHTNNSLEFVSWGTKMLKAKDISQIIYQFKTVPKESNVRHIIHLWDFMLTKYYPKYANIGVQKVYLALIRNWPKIKTSILLKSDANWNSNHKQLFIDYLKISRDSPKASESDLDIFVKGCL